MWLWSAGPNAAASRAAFFTWLDAVMVSICPNCIVLDRWQQRQEGWYQQLKLDQFVKATAFLAALQNPWGACCAAATPPISLGKLYYVAGAGRGSMTMEHQTLHFFSDR
jgi:hypothetical protein